MDISATIPFGMILGGFGVVVLLLGLVATMLEDHR